MVSVANSVGLDYHASGVQVCVMNGQGKVLANRMCANDWTVIRTVAEQYGPVGEAAVESCNGAANLAAELIEEAGWSVSLAHPGYVNRMKQNPDKTDFTDARLLADLVRAGFLPRVWMAPQAIADLREATRYRQQLVNERRNQKLRLGALLRKHRVGRAPANPWTRAWMQWLRDRPWRPVTRQVMDWHWQRLSRLNEEIKACETWLAELTQEDAVVKRLMTIKGIGLVTACVLRAEIGRFERFRGGKQLARFCGLTPRNASSGTRQADAGLIRAGNPQLRTAIIEAAQRLMRFDPLSKSLKQKLVRAGKPYNVAVAAVGNRWIRRLYHLMKEPAAA